MRLGENIVSGFYAIGIPFGSKLRKHINAALIELKETSFFEELKIKWFDSRSQCSVEPKTSSSNSTTNIGLTELTGLFVVISIAIVIALVIGLFECVIRKRLQST